MPAESSNIRAEPCADRERQLLGELWVAHERAARELQAAWSMYCRAHNLADGTVLHAVTADGLQVSGG